MGGITRKGLENKAENIAVQLYKSVLHPCFKHFIRFCSPRPVSKRYGTTGKSTGFQCWKRGCVRMDKWTHAFYDCKEIAEVGYDWDVWHDEWLGEEAWELSARTNHLQVRWSHIRFRTSKRRYFFTQQFSWAVKLGHLSLWLLKVNIVSEGALMEDRSGKAHWACVYHLWLWKTQPLVNQEILQGSITHYMVVLHLHSTLGI